MLSHFDYIYNSITSSTLYCLCQTYKPEFFTKKALNMSPVTLRFASPSKSLKMATRGLPSSSISKSNPN